MLFKRFDVTLNTVMIDDNVIERPSYISVSEWQDFWEGCREGDTWQEGYETGYEEATLEVKKEHRGEIDHLESEHAREVSRLESEIVTLEDRLKGEYDAGFEAGRA